MTTKQNTDIRNIKASLWDVERAAKEMTRFEFVVYFVARKTRRAADRSVVNGYQVVRENDKFYYKFNDSPPMCEPTDDFGKLFDMIRRTPLDHYTHQAEEYRISALS